MFKDALERSKEFIDRYPDEAVTEQARLTMVEACFEYGKFLLDEIEIALEEDPAKVKDLEDLAAGVYRDGADACDKIMEANEDALERPGTKGYNDLYRAWFFKGLLLRENARAVKRDREPLAEFARDVLEEMIFEIGEDTFLGLRGFFEMSQIAEVLGDTDTAISDYKDTIDGIYTVLTSDELELDEATSEALINLLQEAYDRSAEALFLAGRVDEALEICNQFRAHLEEFGNEGVDAFDIAHPTYGHPVFLTEARAMAESGDPDLVAKARTQAQRINAKHPNDMIGTKAKKVLKEILEIASENPDGALLFEVAKGEYQSREYETALMGCKRAYAAMSETQRSALGLALWTTMAKAFGLQRRYLEATLAACTGLERHGGGADDPESTADVLEQAWQCGRHRRGGEHRVTRPQVPRPVSSGARIAGSEHGGGGTACEARVGLRDPDDADEGQPCGARAAGELVGGERCRFVQRVLPGDNGPRKRHGGIVAAGERGTAGRTRRSPLQIPGSHDGSR